MRATPIFCGLAAAAFATASRGDAGMAEPPPAPFAGAVAHSEGPADPADPIAVLYGHRLVFEAGVPLVTVRILEGRSSFDFVPAAPVRISTRGPLQAVARGPAGGRWTVRVSGGTPGRAVARALVAEHLFGDGAGAETDARFYRERGFATVLLSVGTVYGIAGRTVDTRRILVLAEADGTDEGAKALADRLWTRFGVRPEVHREPVERGRGTVEVVSPGGEVVARSTDALSVDVDGDAGLAVADVEHDAGYASHGFETRTYRGRVYAAVDGRGRLAAVNLVPLEALARGIVPSEIFASAPPEALKAQAVTARGELLAKVGARHAGDPYLLCAEQHCQVFRGASGEDLRTSAAVDATRGEALFAPDGGSLVPSYYSAMCGGFTEDNDAVWGGPPDRSIRGRPDFPADASTAPFADGIGEALVRRWLEAKVPAYCATATTSNPRKFRWKRVFTAAQTDALCASLGVGRVKSLEVEGRGVSGRARTLVVRGTKGEARVHGELVIRRLFQMLESGMFVVDEEGRGKNRRFVFRGGGWGHGAGMCQAGAIGRAEKGADYRAILRHYFNGAEVVRMYE